MRDFLPAQALSPSLAPFQDPNFKLAVMAELIEKRVVDLGDYLEFLRGIEGPGYDPATDGQQPSQDAYDYLGRYPLTDSQLESVTYLEFDTALTIYDYVFPGWDGKAPLFDVAKLEDLRLLPKLERLNIVSMLRDTDLKPLRTAGRLERVSLGRIGTWQNFDALLALPRLERLTVFKADIKRWFRSPVLKALREKGVTVTLIE